MTPQERLFALRDQLRNLPPVLAADTNYLGPTFSLDTWYSSYDASTGEFSEDDCMDEEHACKIVEGSCGTSACAFGWAALNPALRAEGLTVEDGAPHYNANDGTEDEPYYNDYYGYAAATKFFGLDKLTTYYLFNPIYYPVNPFDAEAHVKSHDGEPTCAATAEWVANRIDAVLNGDVTADTIDRAAKEYQDTRREWHKDRYVWAASNVDPTDLF